MSSKISAQHTDCQFVPREGSLDAVYAQDPLESSLIISRPKQAALFTQEFDSFGFLSLMCSKLLVQSSRALFYLEFIPLRDSGHFVFGEWH